MLLIDDTHFSSGLISWNKSSQRDPYEVLGVSRDATQHEIKRAFFKVRSFQSIPE
jgi:preprotein translocase subunit Sec63